jgi:plasmid stabilization system protein ParE
MGYQVVLTDAAQADLAKVVRFIAEKSPEAAMRIGNELLDSALSLILLPHRGAPVKRRPGVRRLIYRDYIIFYQVNERTQWVEVIRIWDARQNPLALRLP